jgi:AraC-like DNA-binding protein
MALDRLDALLRHFSLQAEMFHSGALCGLTAFEADAERGQLHLVRRGPVTVRNPGAAPIAVTQPSLLFYPRPLAHRFLTDPDTGADLACAHVRFAHGGFNPLARALPSFVCLPLDALDDTAGLLDALFEEAFVPRCGRQAVVDRLFEVVLIRILRHLMQRGLVGEGLLAGLAEPRIAASLVAMHEAPAQAWTLDALARRAGMSRSAFATRFPALVGVPPMNYLAQWRLSLAQDALVRGTGLKRIATDVGYGSEAALSRAFKAHCGLSPRAWRQAREDVRAP